MGSKVYKQHELTIDIGASSRTNIITNTTFFTMDIKTGKKVINFTLDGERFDLTDATVMLGFEFVDKGTTKIIDSKDGSIIIERPRRGECSVVLPNHLYQYSGPVLVHAYIIFSDGRSFDAGTVATEFEESWLDSELKEMSDFYVKRFEDLVDEIRQRADELFQSLNDVENSIVRQDDLDAHINDWSNPHCVTIGQIPDLQHELDNRSLVNHTHDAQTTITGNAGTATKLQSPRKINSTDFDGSTNITTKQWGMARDITIGDTTRSVDGSGNLIWTAEDIGAAGPAGPQGERGLTGATGPQGPIGLTGPAGATGPRGEDGSDGADGERGATGPQGPQGERGLTGATGAQGPIGLTGPAGPRGEDGADGERGATGSQGPIGLTGPAGATGPRGEDGADGERGATGPQGPQGERGLTGATGAQGPIGLTGPTGPQGERGLTGSTGPQGPQGERGLTGATGVQGPVGLTGPAGPRGEDGADGERGATGPQGPQGERGLTGATGAQGPIGLTGPAGPRGEDGADGEKGATGPQGPIGLTGATGAQGPIGLAGPAGPRGEDGADGERGATGPQGPIGLTGPQGPQGERGLTGAIGPQGPIGLTGPQGPQGERGLTGAIGPAGATGPQGAIGLTGPQGPQGSPTTTITGNAGTATRLQTPRQINGTNFDGSGNITTANWGTARNITIGSTMRSINGGGNASWNLADIGIRRGSVSITPVANTPTSVRVNFGVTLPRVPTVIATPASSVPGTRILGHAINSETTTGFNAIITRTNTGSSTIRWVAIY